MTAVAKPGPPSEAIQAHDQNCQWCSIYTPYATVVSCRLRKAIRALEARAEELEAALTQILLMDEAAEGKEFDVAADLWAKMATAARAALREKP